MHEKIENKLSRRNFLLLSPLGIFIVTGCSFNAAPPSSQARIAQKSVIPFSKKPATSDNIGTLVQLAQFKDEGSQQQILSSAWAPDANMFAIGGADPQVFLRDARTGNLQGTFGDPAQGGAKPGLAWSTDGILLAGASLDGNVYIWNVQKQTVHATLQIGSTNVFCVAWSADRRRLAAGTQGGTILLWDAETSKLLASMQHTIPGTPFSQGVLALAFSPDGHLLASGGFDGILHLWNGSTGLAAGTFTNGPTSQHNDVNGLTWSPDGRLLASADQDGKIRLWNPTSHTIEAELAGHQNWARGVSWTPDNHLLASSGKDGTIRIWNTINHTQVRVLRFPGTVLWNVSWSPDGSRLVFGGDDGIVRLWGFSTK